MRYEDTIASTVRHFMNDTDSQRTDREYAALERHGFTLEWVPADVPGHTWPAWVRGEFQTTSTAVALKQPKQS